MIYLPKGRAGMLLWGVKPSTPIARFLPMLKAVPTGLPTDQTNTTIMARTPQVKELYDIISFRNQIKALQECETMVRYAQSQGFKVPQHVLKQMGDLNAIAHELNQNISQGDLNSLDPRSLNMALIGSLHKEMASVIAPATPATVVLMEQNKRKGLFGLLGPVPLVRQLNIITMFCLIAFLGLFFATDVDSYTVNGDILSYEGPAFIYNELVIVCIAALGASFYALFEVYKYIAKNSYDPKYDSIYWIRFILGIVSGVILAQFIFVDPEILGQGADAVEKQFDPTRDMGTFFTYKPLLAFLGGFSARVVHKILNSMVEAIETFISGSARDAIRAREEAAQVKLEEQLRVFKQKNAQVAAVQRMEATAKLMQLKEEITQGAANNEDVTFRLNQLMNEFMQPVAGNAIQFTNIGQPKPNVSPAYSANPKTQNSYDTSIINDPNQPQTEPLFPKQPDYPRGGNLGEDEPFLDEQGNPIVIRDVDEIDIPDFPEDLENPDFNPPHNDDSTPPTDNSTPLKPKS